MAVTASKRRPGAPAAWNKAIRRAGACAVLALAFAPTAHAIDWRFGPYVNASSTYTDNVKQSSSNTQDALILTATPGFTLRSEGSRRVQASLQYGLTGVKRFGGDQSDNFYHNLNAAGKAELVQDFLFIDGSANISQQLISLLGSPADATTNNSNRTTVGTYSISPYIQQRLGTFARAQVRYTQSGALFQNNVANNINSNSINASLNSGTQFNELSWGLNYRLRDATVQGGEDTQFEHYGASLGYRLSHTIRVFGTVGHDSNKYSAAPGAGVGGGSWTVGMGWAPNRRTSMNASFGESYFGRTYGFDFDYRTHYSVWTASYNEGVSDISQLLLNTEPISYWICDQGLALTMGTLPPPNGTSCLLIGSLPPGSTSVGSANGIFISKTLRAGGAWSKGKSNFGVNVFDTRRQYQQLVGMPEDETRGVIATYSYRLQPHTTLNANLGYTNTLVPPGLGLGFATTIARNDKLYTASIGVSHQFDPKLSSSLTLRHQQRDSNNSTSSFDENSLTASVNMRF